MRFFALALGVFLASFAAYAAVNLSDQSYERVSSVIRTNLFVPVDFKDYQKTVEIAQEPQGLSEPIANQNLQRTASHEAIPAAKQIMEERAKAWAFEQNIDEFQEHQEFVRQLPDNLNVYIAETVNDRLTMDDIKGLPAEVKIAVWPDSALVRDFEHDVYLINPPTDRMEYYYIQPVTQDESDFYFNALARAEGIFVRRGDILFQTPSIRELMFEAASREEIAIMAVTEIEPDFDTKGAEFGKINYQMRPDEIAAQWAQLLERSSQGETLNIVLEANGEAVSALNEVLLIDKETRFAEILKEKAEAERQAEEAEASAKTNALQASN